MKARILAILVLGSYAARATSAAAQTADISAVFAEGKVTGNQYENDYFGLTLTTEDAQFTKGGFISSQGKRARLIDAEANAKRWEDKYSIAILADALSATPRSSTCAVCVTSSRKRA